MSLKQTIARNVIWNWAGTATHMLAGFIVFPILVQRLGTTDCGLWLLIIGLTYYFDLLDLGLRSSLGRNIAYFRAKGDHDGVNAVFSTGLALLSAGALLVLAATCLVQMIFFDLFQVPAEAEDHARTAIWLIGVNLALMFPFYTFQGLLWGHQRFDLLNCIDIPCVILRAALAIWLVGSGSENLVTMSLIHLGITVVQGTGFVLVSFAVVRGLRLSPRQINLATTRNLFDFGIWVFLLSIAIVVSGQLGPFLIANQLRIALVTPFSAAARLVGYVKTLLVSTTGVLTPVATALFAAEDHTQQRWLFLQGGKACMAVALFFFGGFLFLGDSFLWLWTGRGLEHAWIMLVILMLGELLPLSQWVTYSTVIGMNRHRLWAVMSMLEVVLIVGLAFGLLTLNHSIFSIALALAIPGTICRGLIQMIYACRLLKVPFTQYLGQALLPPVLVAAGPILLLGMLTNWHYPDSWPVLIGLGLLYSVAFGLVAGLFLIGPGRLRTGFHTLLGRSHRAAEDVGPVEAQVVPTATGAVVE